ncbi:hypothetical protein DFJ74DRAFT_656031 [Hyaloraphidium curvatum]|nr:hypothetical protein DFJ74DRAFT_656031 [Hyaloraphidium curvatum]
MRRIGRRNRHRKDHMPRRRRLLRREGAVERPRRVRRLRTRPRRQLLLERVLPPRKLLPDRELKPRRRSPSESSLHRRHRPRRQRRRRLTKRGTGGTYKGWASDAEKNLPAFVELWNRFPDAKWYLMVDDDAYPFLASLWRHLESHYDASEVHYIGKAFQFTGCHWEPRADDRVKELYFASGGAGIVLSRGAMLAALPLARLGVQLTKGCWAGDARVAIWLYEARARLEWPWQVGGRMHVGPQGPWHSFGRACDPVLTYHLVPPDKYPRIGAVERSPASGGGHVTNADMWHVFWDRAGEELLGLEGRVDRDTGRGGMDFLELSPAPEGGTVDDFGEAAEEDLADLLEGTYNKPHLTDKVRRGLNATGLDPRTPMYRKAALALRCMEACHALDRVTDIPAAVAVPPRPVDAFHGRVAKPANLLDNRSSRFGPCTQWTLAPNGACWLKSGFSQPGAAGGHWSGIVDGALERYAAVGKDRAAGALCGWDAGVRDG